MKVKNILKTTIEEALELYNNGMVIIIRDGKIKGFTLEPKSLENHQHAA